MSEIEEYLATLPDWELDAAENVLREEMTRFVDREAE